MTTSPSDISTCQVHEESQFPNVKALEFCKSCEAGMCYICANDHIDSHHIIDWGFDIFNHMETPRNEKNEQFNSGYRTLFDFSKAKCPCGSNLVGKKTSTICACCGTATCSGECHDKYVQSQGKCLFIRNFVINDMSNNIQGMRNIMWINEYAMRRDNHPEHTPCSRISPKFMTATLGPHKHSVYLQRGFRQYGQPLEETLEGMVEVVVDDNDIHFQNNNDKLCMCECEHCASNSPHPIGNCFFKCKSRVTFDEATMTKLGMRQECVCQCSDCIGMPNHFRSDCFDFCRSSPFTK